MFFACQHDRTKQRETKQNKTVGLPGLLVIYYNAITIAMLALLENCLACT